MNSQRALIAISSALALFSLIGCLRKPVVTYVNQNLTLNDYVEPGQVLQWRVSSPQSPPFTFHPDSEKFCSTFQPYAKYGTPATCLVAKQHYPDGVQMNVYTYELTYTQNEERSSASKRKGSDEQAPAGPRSQSPSSGVFAQRVGSCGPCSAKRIPAHPVAPGSPPAGPANPEVTLICSDTKLIVQQTQPASVGSSITWLNSQYSSVGDWTIEFKQDGVCTPKPINAGHDNCTLQAGTVTPDYSYQASLYKKPGDYSPANLVCAGTVVLTVQ